MKGIQAGAHTHARTLQGLDTYVREIIVLGADLQDGAEKDLRVGYHF